MTRIYFHIVNFGFTYRAAVNMTKLYNIIHLSLYLRLCTVFEITEWKHVRHIPFRARLRLLYEHICQRKHADGEKTNSRLETLSKLTAFPGPQSWRAF